MTDIFLERNFEPAIDSADVLDMAREAAGCFAIHRVGWNCSYLSGNGAAMLCWFSGPDTESARIALRQVGAHIDRIWPGTIHEAPVAAVPNVAVERSFDRPVALEDIQAIEDAGSLCLETHRVRFARTFFSRDRRRMISLYEAPDAEAVRQAQRDAGMPLDRVWAFRQIGPGDMQTSPS